MTSRDFCYWLQGFFEIRDAGPQPPEPEGGPQPLTAAQADMIRRHLSLVFLHEIDPSAGGPEEQAKLNAVHAGVTKEEVEKAIADARRLIDLLMPDLDRGAELVAERDAQAEARVRELEAKRQRLAAGWDGAGARMRELTQEVQAARINLGVATDRVRELEAELETANHWRERHSRDAEAYGIQSNENWKRAKALKDEVARLIPLVADGGVSAVQLDAVLAAFPCCCFGDCKKPAIWMAGNNWVCEDHEDRLQGDDETQEVPWLLALELAEGGLRATPVGQDTVTPKCGEQTWRAGQYLTCQLPKGHAYPHLDSGVSWVSEPESPAQGVAFPTAR